jgi:hypothetical protein
LISRYSPEKENYRELVPIENIRHGDKVWSYNLKTQHWETRLVLETFRRNYVGDVVAVQFEEETINATGGHPFWVIEGSDLETRPLCDCLPCTEQNLSPNGRWVYARDLQIGDKIQSRANDLQKVLGLTIEITETLVYNFLVDDLHNYAVGNSDLLVHNTNSPAKSAHAITRAKQGRPVGNALSDAQNAASQNVFLQEDGRYFVSGPKGRAHVFEMNGDIVTSLRNVSKSNIQKRLNSQQISRVSLEQFEKFRSIFQ